MRYPAIQKLMLNGNWEEALACSKKMLKLHPGDADALNLAQACITMLDIQKSVQKQDPAFFNEHPFAYYRSLFRLRSGNVISRILQKIYDCLPEKLQKRLQAKGIDVRISNLQKPEYMGKEDFADQIFRDPHMRKVLLAVTGGLIVIGLLILLCIVCSG